MVSNFPSYFTFVDNIMIYTCLFTTKQNVVYVSVFLMYISMCTSIVSILPDIRFHSGSLLRGEKDDRKKRRKLKVVYRNFLMYVGESVGPTRIHSMTKRSGS